MAFGLVSQSRWIENIIYYSELHTDSIHSNLFLVHLATLLFKRPPKQPDKLIICSAMFYCCYLREEKKIFLVYPLRTGVMRRHRLTPLHLCVHGPLRVYTHSWSWNKWDDYVDSAKRWRPLYTRSAYFQMANQWLISGNVERILCDLSFSRLLFSLSETKDMW